MAESKEYRLYVQTGVKISLFGMLFLFLVMGILMLSGVLQSASSNGPPKLFGLFFFGMIGWFLYYIYSIPHKILVSESGHIEFISGLRKKRVAAHEIESMQPDTNQFGFLRLKTKKGKIRILNQFDGFHEFIIALKIINPSVKLRGC